MRELIAPGRRPKSSAGYRRREFRALCWYSAICFLVLVLAGVWGAWAGIDHNDTPVGVEEACSEWQAMRGGVDR
jgi:hypothetical protein